MKPVAIIASGMVTSVGLNAASSCAAIRCAIDNFSETKFVEKGGQCIVGAQVSLQQPWRGLKRLVKMVAPAITECLATLSNLRPEQLPLLLCVAERERPGRLDGLDEQLLEHVQAELGVRFHPRSAVIAKGRVGGAYAVGIARELICEENIPACIVAGVDSLLVAETLDTYDNQDRLLTSPNSNGFIPGEAGAAIALSPANGLNVSRPHSPNQLSSTANLLCLGIGLAHEKSTLASALPLRGDGLVQAFHAAFSDAGCGFERVDYRLTDANGEQYWFKEAALAIGRTMRVLKASFYLCHTADCIGETGAATVPCALGVALLAARKAYAPGPGVLCHFGNDLGERAALVLETTLGRN